MKTVCMALLATFLVACGAGNAPPPDAFMNARLEINASRADGLTVKSLSAMTFKGEASRKWRKIDDNTYSIIVTFNDNVTGKSKTEEWVFEPRQDASGTYVRLTRIFRNEQELSPQQYFVVADNLVQAWAVAHNK